MMYISIFPVAISVRRTNVYEEKSLGLWGGDDEDEGSNNQSYVGTHLRRQLSFDLWYVFLGLFIIAIAEGERLQNTNEYVSPPLALRSLGLITEGRHLLCSPSSLKLCPLTGLLACRSVTLILMHRSRQSSTSSPN